MARDKQAPAHMQISGSTRHNRTSTPNCSKLIFETFTNTFKRVHFKVSVKCLYDYDTGDLNYVLKVNFQKNIS